MPTRPQYGTTVRCIDKCSSMVFVSIGEEEMCYNGNDVDIPKISSTSDMTEFMNRDTCCGSHGMNMSNSQVSYYWQQWMWVTSSSHTAQWPSGIIYVRTDDREFELLKTLLNTPVLSLCLRLSEETLRWFLSSVAYSIGSKIFHTGGKCVTCRGFHHF